MLFFLYLETLNFTLLWNITIPHIYFNNTITVFQALPDDKGFTLSENYDRIQREIFILANIGAFVD